MSKEDLVADLTEDVTTAVTDDLNPEDLNNETAESKDTGIEEIEEVINKRPKKDKIEIPQDFFYDYDQFVSPAVVSEESGLPLDVVRMTHSFGYNCHKRDNLAILDHNTICFIAGNYLQFINLENMSNKYMRSLSGGGLGCLSVHPSKTFIAVGEKSFDQCPMVAIYAYPSLKLYRLLKGGTERAYAYSQFNPSGELLATVGSDPDYMLTVWDWENEQTVLRSKAFSQDVHRVLWSNDLEGILTTGGTGHIRFWKMADTFTGLKLQGYIGKFGKTEISDIEGFIILPDGKVLSGCESGNLLVWDGDLIKVQLGRKNKKTCHNGPICQVVMEEGELMTVGMDGKINTWDFETIDTAEVAEEMAIFEMEPMNELVVSPDAKLMHIVKSTNTESSIWYAQDGNGRIWKLDLSFSHTSTPPQVLETFHSGEIKDCDVSPLSYLSASIGSDGVVRVFDFAAKSLLAESRFNFEGSKLIWAPHSVDRKGKTIIAGFLDGVIRILNFTDLLEADTSKKSKFIADITLIQALKPHTKNVTALCVDTNGEILITGSEDETVFFFSIATPEYFPIGFVNFEKGIRHIEWKESNPHKPDEGIGRVVVYMDGGEVAEVICPNPMNVDHSKTFELREISPLNSYKFVSIKSKLRHEEELEKKRIEEEERQKILEKERKSRLERGLETEEEQHRQIEEDERRRLDELAKEEEWVPFIPDQPSPICYGFVDKFNENKFWLSMGNFDAGYLYQCEFPDQEKQNLIKIPEKYNEPLNSPSLHDPQDSPVTCMKWSSSGKRLLMGFENGSIRLQNVDSPFDLNSMTSSWKSSMHDNNYGAITSLCLSYDEKFIVSVGKDGNYFVYELMDESLQEKQIEEYRARLPSAKVVVTKEKVEDINDPNAYSIEEHKQKSEYDRMVRMATEKKAATLKKIQELQKQFKQLKDQNEKLPDRIRIKSSSFELVPQLRSDLINMKEEQIELLHKQLAFESERHRIALEKLHKRFREPLECDHTELHAIQSDHTVTTIRGCNLSEIYFQVLSDLDRIRKDIVNKELSKDASGFDKKNFKAEESEGQTKVDDGLSKCNLKGARGMRVARQMKKLEDNRKKRAFRKIQWNQLYSEKPMDDYEDPRDIEAINEACNKMGDFKLKSSNDYFVEENERPNAYKSRCELLSITNTTFQMRSTFNKNVLALRDNKLEIINLIKNTNEQIDICNKIPHEIKRNHIPEIVFQPQEFPEKKFEFTKETLLDFKKELEERKKAVIQGEETSKQTFISFNKSAADSGMKSTKVTRPHNVHQQVVVEEVEIVKEEDNTGPQLSNLQKERQIIKDIKTVHRTDAMINETFKQIRIFDTKLKLLRHEKFKLSLCLRRANLRQLTVFEEYRLLKMYEKSERTLVQKTEDKTSEKVDITIKVSELQMKIDSTKKEIDRLLERDRLTFDKFKESLGENNKFFDYLNKVYKKKIKRRKKEADGETETSDDSSDSDDSDLDESEGDSDEDAIVYDLDMCPAGCSQELYDSTCQLREVRLDIEEQLLEEKKTFEALKKEQENLNKKAKIVDTALAQAKKEVEAFQLEKQQKMNQLNVIVILKLHQILYHDNGNLPANNDVSLVFEACNYRNLKARIQRLQEEEKHQINHGKNAKLRHMKLLKSKKLFEKKILDTHVETNDMMTTKFGKLDNLEKMEQVMINPKIEELTFKMLELQDDMYCEQSQWEDRIRDAQEVCIHELKINTCTLDKILQLYNDKEDLADKLDSKQKDLGGEYQLTGPAAEEEIIKLNQLVQIQAQELDALKEEIAMLSRKGGHILPPVNQQNNNFANHSTLEPSDYLQDSLMAEN